MPTDQSETIERFAFEGLLSIGSACALAGVIAVLSAWLLWRERRLVGRGWAAVFWLLRMGAIAAVTWMLLGPTELEIRRLTSPQSIAIVVDASTSMDETDPDAAREDLRWTLASSSEASPVADCDRATVALAAAVTSSERILDAAEGQNPLRRIAEETETVKVTTDRAAELLRVAARQLAERDTRLADRSERIIALLEEPLTHALDELSSEAAASERASLTSVNESARAVTDLVRGAHRRSLSLAAEVAQREADRRPGESGSTRRERASGLLSKLESGAIESLAKQCRVHRYHFDAAVTPTTAESWGGREAAAESPPPTSYDEPRDSAEMATDLSVVLSRLAQLRSSEPLKMALLVTDGRHNAPESTAPQEVAAGLEGIPVHVVPLGVTTPARDVLIHRVEAPRAVVLKDTAAIEVLVTTFDCRDERLTVTLRRDGEEVDRKTLGVTRDRSDHRLTFRVTADELGMRQYDIEVTPVADEASLTNNLSSIALEVVRDKIRVLLADRVPRYEYRYLQQLFRRDEHVVFDEFLSLPKLRATGELEAVRELPRLADDWGRYDVVILGDLGPERLDFDQQESLAEYVRKGGGNLIIVAGREHMPSDYRLQPLGELIPVEEAPTIDPRVGFSVTMPSAPSQASAVLIRDSLAESRQVWESTFRLAPIYGLSRYSRPKSNAQTLLTAEPVPEFRQAVDSPSGDDQRAFLCWAPIGAGRVAYLAAPQTYLLRFRQGDRDHHRFWGQTLRWITAAQVGSGSDRVRIETDRNRYERGQPVEVTVWLSDQRGRPVKEAGLKVQARSLGETVATIEMRPDGGVAGRYVGSFGRLPMGTLGIVPAGELVEGLLKEENQQVVAEPVQTLITVEASSGIELVNTQANRPLLEQIATLTGGQALPPTAVEEVFRLMSLDPEVTEQTTRTPIWNRWTNLLIVLGCLFTEWAVRKHKGLT